jgi:hypothetical protein
MIEQFDIVFEDMLVKSFDNLSRLSSCDTKGKRQLRDVLLPRKEEILNRLNRLKDLQKMAKNQQKEMVICHTDLHGENLMLDNMDNLYILDWENAMIAPSEHDLFFFAGYDSFWDVFLPNYQRVFGPVNLNHDVFGFYYYRRGLEDLADWIIRILRSGGSDTQDRADLEEIEDCLGGLSYVEKTLVVIEERLEDLP